MPYGRLMYDGDNNYTKKEKRMILLTQEAIDKINGLTPGGGAGATFVTQEEYDALPSSKLTDGIEYIIVDTHCELKNYPELAELEAEGGTAAIVTELNTCPKGYLEMFKYNGMTWPFDVSSQGTTLPTGKHLIAYSISLYGINGAYFCLDTDLTAQEYININPGTTLADAERLVSGDRAFDNSFL